MKRILLLMISCFYLGHSFSQSELYSFQSRNHMVSREEMLHLEEAGKGFTPTPPPGGKVRSIAEFEPTEGVIVGYPGQFGIPYNLIAEMSQVAKIYTIVASASAENNVRNQYLANGIDTGRCVFVRGALDSYWSRDYGPWFIADSANRVAIIDFPYNRPRPNDNDVPGLIASALGLTMYGMNVKHTGGNYMSDGRGIAASTELVITENTNLTVTQINTFMQDYLGIDNYYRIDDPLGDYIEHIDCWGKFLAPDKFLLAEVPSNDPRYQDYEAIATYMAGEISSYGTPFRVLRVYSPNGQPYTNSYILNNRAFIPMVTTNGTPWNDSALAVYARAMPGYQVTGIYALSGKPWAGTDALHCRVHEIADRGMLYIRHIPIQGEVLQKPSYEVRAEIIPYSGSLLYPDSVYVRYRFNAGLWHQVLMLPDTGYVWVTQIPDSAGNVTISYFIHAADQSGRSENHPYIGMDDAHQFKVKSSIGITEAFPRSREILVFPNPCDDRLYAAISNPGGNRVVARMFSLSGQLMKEVIFENEHKVYHEGLSVSDIRSGVYLIEIITGTKHFRQRITVVHP